MPGYAELQVTSNYSFLRGASHIEELLVTAKTHGLEAVAITDRNSLAGIAMAHARAHEVDIRLLVGCRLDLRDGLPLLVYPTDRAAYGRLCRLITLGKSRTGKGGFDIGWQDLVDHAEGLIAILLPEEPDASWRATPASRAIRRPRLPGAALPAPPERHPPADLPDRDGRGRRCGDRGGRRRALPHA